MPWLAVVAVALAFCCDATAAQQRYIDGVFVASPNGPVELITYAEPSGTGLLHLAYGSMDDVPTLRAGCRILVSLPAWRPAGAIIATESIFEDHRAERRDLRWFHRPLNIYAADLEFKDLGDAKFVARRLKDVKASEERPAYVFVIVSNSLTARTARGDIARFYPLRLEPPPVGSTRVTECASVK